MTSKQPSPTLSKTATSTRSKKLIMMALLSLAVVIAYFVWARPLSTTPTPIKETTTKTVPSQVDTLSKNVDSNSSEAAGVVKTNNPSSPTENTESIETQVTDSEVILNAKLPETDTLAKEEVDRLEDERQRLIEQEKLAVEQVQMNKKLTDMKAEQIKLLEQQIAQLEAAQTTTQ
ncbi:MULTISPECIES: hypothetical protein [unclassified Psychrobacter]|uniref:hypothetical protein n=1 Tax=unclassified Psychrobacter TaxID=196806 RepID=UPI00117B1BDA|nr:MULTISPECIES: hypothetical protein [unclassified Psychrobacter]